MSIPLINEASAVNQRTKMEKGMDVPGTATRNETSAAHGDLWPEEFEGTEDMSFFEPDDAELQREELAAGSVVTFKQDPEIPKGAAWLDVVSQDGEKLCDIPWNATPEEESAVMLVVDKINEGREVWGEVTATEHSTIDAGPDNARIHSIEFDVFYR